MPLFKKKKRQSRRRTESLWIRCLGAAVPAVFSSVGIKMLCVVVAAAALLWAETRLEAYVRARPRYQGSAHIDLLDVPKGLSDRIVEVLTPISDAHWLDRDLCRRAGDLLAKSPWVEHVRSVRKTGDGRLAVSCRYRAPAALVQRGNDFALASTDGVRLPGRYGYHPDFVVIQGAAAEPPPPGEPWVAKDVRAALEIIRLLSTEPFFAQLTGVRVHNYGGRRDRLDPHISLTTAGAGTRIDWGSAPGEEVEENSVEEKIELLNENYRRWGRIDAGRERIDISTFPDRFTTPATTSPARR